MPKRALNGFLATSLPIWQPFGNLFGNVTDRAVLVARLDGVNSDDGVNPWQNGTNSMFGTI